MISFLADRFFTARSPIRHRLAGGCGAVTGTLLILGALLAGSSLAAPEEGKPPKDAKGKPSAEQAKGTAPEEGKQYKDWTIRCQTLEQGKPDKACFLTQTINDKESKKPMIDVRIGYLGKDNQQPAAIFAVPLGAALRPGLGFKIDDEKPMGIPYDFCDPVGCRATLPLDNALVAKLKGGKTSQIIFFHITSQNPITNDLSLNGFTAGFDALGK